MTETLPSNATSLNTRYPRVRIVGNEKKMWYEKYQYQGIFRKILHSPVDFFIVHT